MSCRKGFRAFDTSGGWPIGNVKSCFRFAVFWPKRRNRPPVLPTSRLLRNARSARGPCALLNALPPDRFAIRQRSQSPSLSILLSEASNTAACMLLWGVRHGSVLSPQRRSFFPSLGRGRTEQWALWISSLTCISARPTHGSFQQRRIPRLNTHRPASAANVPAAHYKPPNRKCSG